MFQKFALFDFSFLLHIQVHPFTKVQIETRENCFSIVKVNAIKSIKYRLCVCVYYTKLSVLLTHIQVHTIFVIYGFGIQYFEHLWTPQNLNLNNDTKNRFSLIFEVQNFSSADSEDMLYDNDYFFTL